MEHKNKYLIAIVLELFGISMILLDLVFPIGLLALIGFGFNLLAVYIMIAEVLISKSLK